MTKINAHLPISAPCTTVLVWRCINCTAGFIALKNSHKASCFMAVADYSFLNLSPTHSLEESVKKTATVQISETA